jgi:hypothetical protein
MAPVAEEQWMGYRSVSAEYEIAVGVKEILGCYRSEGKPTQDRDRACAAQTLASFMMRPAPPAVELTTPRDRSTYGGVWISVVLYAILFAADLVLSLVRTGGHFAYPLDDTYITMALAKNLAAHGVWGVTRYGFTSASSTPLYALLLAATFSVTGAVVWAPLAVAFLGGAAAVWAVAATVPADRRTLAAIATVLLCPLNVIAQTGMEHTMHVALTVVFAARAATVIAERRRMDWIVLLVAPFLVMTRYEGLFLVFIAVALLFLRRMYRFAIAVAICAAVPVIGTGLVSLSNGWYFLPNSLLLKGTPVSSNPLVLFFTVVFHIQHIFARDPHMIGVAAALALTVWATRNRASTSHGKVIAQIAGFTLLAHACTAEFGWVFRYGCYLIALAVVAVVCAFPCFNAKVQLVVVIAGLGLLAHSVYAIAKMPPYTNAIYSQQVQMARFIKRYYDHGSIALNDIGAVNYFADVRCLDLTGLANKNVLASRRGNRYTTATIDALATAENVQIAILYEPWFSLSPADPRFGGPPLPTAWRRVGRWRVSSQEQLGLDTVSFYAVSEAEVEPLRQHLREFRSSLPAGVIPIEN